MPQMLQRAADDRRPDVKPGQQFTVHKRFVGLDAGQTVEVVDASDETLADGAYPERLTLQLTGSERLWAGASEMPYHGDDVRAAVERGDLELL
ncbi:hypothetical protein ACFR9U_20845 [Halorientalis brevis]|uniref:Uncharacterized protein n=1 Tax=Halorientalis brevis TaxID=1126241 RepID=A0ABD6CH95_9EURY|nr:hypothetical protein [Halorientalis brevis]